MSIGLSRWPMYLSLLVALLCVGCGSSVSRAQGPGMPSGGQSSSGAATASSATFTLEGGQVGNYSLHTTTPTSKLRHGHYEFTIDLVSAGVSLFIVFYGYRGPGKYALTNAVNGGDVHIGLQSDTLSWDLFVRPTASCSLVVASDTPTGKLIAASAAPAGSTGLDNLDRLSGLFTCPSLFSSAPGHPQAPIRVTNGSFSLAMLVES